MVSTFTVLFHVVGSVSYTNYDHSYCIISKNIAILYYTFFNFFRGGERRKQGENLVVLLRIGSCGFVCLSLFLLLGGVVLCSYVCLLLCLCLCSRGRWVWCSSAWWRCAGQPTSVPRWTRPSLSTRTRSRSTPPNRQRTSRWLAPSTAVLGSLPSSALYRPRLFTVLSSLPASALYRPRLFTVLGSLPSSALYRPRLFTVLGSLPASALYRPRLFTGLALYRLFTVLGSLPSSALYRPRLFTVLGSLSHNSLAERKGVKE